MSFAGPLPSPVETASFRRRAIRFFKQVGVALATAYAALLLFGAQMGQVGRDGALEYPVWAALRAVDAAVHETTLKVEAAAPAGAGTMAELKALAQKLAAGRRSISPPELWSQAEEGYRVVYFRGRDEAGGLWIASARHIEAAFPGAGEGEIVVALVQERFGSVESPRPELHRMVGELQRAVGAPLPEAVMQMRVGARLPESGEAAWEEAAGRVVAALGGEGLTLRRSAGEVRATAYSPRLAGSAERDGGAVNIEVRIARHGQAPWIEVGVPTL